MRRSSFALIALLAAPALQAHEYITTKITFAQEISRLFNKKCVSCHREGGVAPFALTTWEEARPWAKAIKEEVLERRMPPWSAVKGFGQFKGDMGLTMEEVKLIADWVEGGAPAGKDIYLPKPPKLPDVKDPGAPRGAVELAVTGKTSLTAPARILAIRPKKLDRGASVQVIATRPDGSIEPLIWINNHQPGFTRTYHLAQPLSLPAGTRIETAPPGAGTFALYKAAPKPAAKPAE